MKYVVICYYLNDMEIMSVDSFDNKQDAINCLKSEAENAYNIEVLETPDEYIDDVWRNIDEEYAYLWNKGSGSEWTWHVIEVA